MRRKRHLMILLAAVSLGVLGAHSAYARTTPDGPKGAACPDASPQPDNTPPNCGNDGTNGGGGDHGGGSGDHGSNACPDPSHNPDNTPGHGSGENCGTDDHGGGGDGGCTDTDHDGTCDDDDPCPSDPTNNCNPQSTFDGPCHRHEGVLGPNGLGLVNDDSTNENPLAEQLYHGLDENGAGDLLDTLGVEHPGADTTALDGDNSSLGATSQGLYEGTSDQDPPFAAIGPELGCATDLLNL